MCTLASQTRSIEGTGHGLLHQSWHLLACFHFKEHVSWEDNLTTSVMHECLKDMFLYIRRLQKEVQGISSIKLDLILLQIAIESKLHSPCPSKAIV
jgi:hypothetical protein